MNYVKECTLVGNCVILTINLVSASGRKKRDYASICSARKISFACRSTLWRERLARSSVWQQLCVVVHPHLRAGQCRRADGGGAVAPAALDGSDQLHQVRPGDQSSLSRRRPTAVSWRVQRSHRASRGQQPTSAAPALLFPTITAAVSKSKCRPPTRTRRNDFCAAEPWPSPRGALGARSLATAAATAISATGRSTSWTARALQSGSTSLAPRWHPLASP